MEKLQPNPLEQRWSPWLVDDCRTPFFICPRVDFFGIEELCGPPEDLRRLPKSDVEKNGGGKSPPWKGSPSFSFGKTDLDNACIP